MDAQSGAVVGIMAGEKGGEGNTLNRHLIAKLFQSVRIQLCLTVAIDESEVGEKRPCQEIFLCDDMKGPALLSGKSSADRQLALHDRPSQLIGGFDFHEASLAVSHVYEEIGHDVACAGLFASGTARRRRSIEELDSERSFGLVPGIPDCQRLFLQMRHLRARDQDHGSSGFELTLAADRTSLVWTRDEQERAGRAPAQAEGRDAYGVMGHGRRAPGGTKQVRRLWRVCAGVRVFWGRLSDGLVRCRSVVCQWHVVADALRWQRLWIPRVRRGGAPNRPDSLPNK